MKKLALTIMALPLLIGCGSSKLDTNWVYLKENESIEVVYGTKSFTLRFTQGFEEISYRCQTEELNIKYVVSQSSEKATNYMNIYGEYTLVHIH